MPGFYLRDEVSMAFILLLFFLTSLLVLVWPLKREQIFSKENIRPFLKADD